MLTRIVKMTFEASRVEAFERLFDQRKERIAAFPGCKQLRLLRDTTTDNVFFTISLWDSPADLEAYRASELFKDTWSQTKILFSDRPRAWSLNTIWDTTALDKLV